MPAYQVRRSVRIDAGQSQVRPAIDDFANWPKWSPWLCMEPTANVTVFGTPGQVGHGYEWDGELVGAGSIRITSVEGDRQKMDLAFLRPFKSQAKVMIETKAIGDLQTEVTWQLDGSMPFFLFFMVGMMKGMIGMDFARGLRMLKDYVETGGVLSKTEIVGVVDVPQTHYLGVSDRCAMDEIGDSMQRTMPAAYQCATEHQIEMQGPPGALYHHVGIKQQRCHYTAIMQTKSPVQVDGAATGTIPACKALKVVHTGNYKHLGNAWSTAMAYQRYKKLKPLKSQCNFELYPNDPAETPEQDWRTELYLPVRG